MKTMSLDNNNDICLCRYGNIKFSEGLEAVLQVCECYARAALGEMVAKKNKGVPFFQTVFGASPDIALFESKFKSRILEVEGVIAVREFSAHIKDNELFYSATIETIYGIGELNNGRL